MMKPTIPDTFCPAKWDELLVSVETNYAYSCCHSIPTKFDGHVLEFVSKERLNMKNGVQDKSCEYCWSVERNGGSSLRQEYLKSFDVESFGDYSNDKTPKFLQVSVGNECNFQCTYCNPKFSSKWEHDVKLSEYKVFSDRYFWGIHEKNDNIMEKNIAFLAPFGRIETFSIVGGEPLFNKKTFELIELVDADMLQITTNLSCKTGPLDRLFLLCSKFNLVKLSVSIDSVGAIAEFTRYGLDFAEFKSNFQYLLANKPDNLKVHVNSVMSSITVRDFANFSEYMTPYLDNIKWEITYCRDPITQSMATLPTNYRDSILLAIDRMSRYNIEGLDALKTVVSTTPFNKVMHQQLKHFMQEFATRKKIEIPLCLD